MTWKMLCMGVPVTIQILIGFILIWNPASGASHQCTFNNRPDGTGTMSSPNYPGSYGNRQECLMEVVVEEGYVIKFTFAEQFGLECGYDYVQFSPFDVVSQTYGSPQQFCTNPRTYVSPSHKVQVKFRSDDSTTYSGFSATWEKSGIPCGRRMVGMSSGTIHYHPGEHYNWTDTTTTRTGLEPASSSSPSATCIWTIEAPQDFVVRLEFDVNFDLGVDDDDVCLGDVIQVFDDLGKYDEMYTNQRGRWCGTDRPPIVTSMGQTMLIDFHRTGIPHNRNFTFRWQSVKECGGLLTSEEGYIIPSVMNQNFAQNCTWYIHADSNRDFTLQLEGVPYPSLCRDWQILEYSEEQEEYLPHQDWCQGNATDESPQRKLRSSSNKIKIEYDMVPPSFEASNFHVHWELGCGERLSAPSGNFTSTGYGTAYPDSQDCRWVIRGKPDHAIRLDFHSAFDIEASNDGECSYDYLEVFDSLPETSELVSLGRFCGAQPPQPIIASGDDVVVQFHSDEHKNGQGFAVTWESSCGAVYEDLQGSIASPNYPSSYPDNFDCRWEIQVPQDYTIRLSFNKPFHLELAGGCGADYLEIYDYRGQSWTKRGRWCGRELPPTTTSVTSRMALVFHSDGVKSRTGFKAEWTSLNASSFDCGGEFESSEGTLTSPRFPQAYRADTKCRWAITANEGQRLKLDFGSTFDLESDKDGCRYDGVEVLDTLPNGKMVSYGKWCSVREIPIFHSTTRLVVLFYSDSGKNGQGFEATWTSEPECGWPITGTSGHLLTPGYPSLYPENRECRWEIKPEADGPEGPEGGAGNNVTLHFDPRFDLEVGDPDCIYDFVEIRRGSDVIGRWCGTDAPPDVTSDGQTLEVVFKSDKSVRGKGFLATLS